MVPSDLARGVAFMESRWGFQKKWANTTSFFEDFAPYTAGALMETLNSWFRAGNKFPPAPSELVKAIGETQVRRIAHGQDNLDDTPCAVHLWAAPDAWDEDRHQVCVRCGETGAVWACSGHVYQNGPHCAYCPSPNPAKAS